MSNEDENRSNKPGKDHALPGLKYKTLGQITTSLTIINPNTETNPNTEINPKPNVETCPHETAIGEHVDHSPRKGP